MNPPPGFGPLEYIKSGPREWTLTAFWRTPYGVVPAGFVSDGASSPRLAFAIVDPGSEFLEASVIHDFLYRYGIGTRKEADRAWRDTALSYGASPRRTRLGYFALRVGGVNFGWNKVN